MDIRSRPSPGQRAPAPVRRRHRLRTGKIGAFTAAMLAVGLAAGYGASPAQTSPARMASARAVATEANPAPEVPSPSLRSFYTQQLSWGPCEPHALTPAEQTSFRDASLDCAFLSVPLDYTHPEGRTAQIGVLRKKATDPTHRIGSLITNPGGPGGSGMEYLPTLAGRIGNGELAQRFDLIGFDPRGVGASTPAIHCQTSAERDAERAEPWLDPSSPAAAAHKKDQAKGFAAKCASRTGRDVLAHMGTREVVRDLDILRTALGDNQLTYLGYSYGTSIGTGYAEAFPTHVRALVLDGAINPAETGKRRATNQGNGFKGAFNAFAVDCATHADCPLGTDPKAAEKRFNTLIAPLATHPAPTRDGRRTLSYRDALTAKNHALYNPRLWAPLRTGLTKLATGDGTILLKLADIHEGRAEDGSYSGGHDAFRAISCVDGLFGQCRFWPVPPTGRPHHPTATGLPTVLIISTTADPATPYKSGVNLANELHGRLLTAEGTQHTVALKGTRCVDDAVTHYLVDRMLPAPGTRCTITNRSRPTNRPQS
jgi:pimeloyl-ACP methyl ester carboxylesterase